MNLPGRVPRRRSRLPSLQLFFVLFTFCRLLSADAVPGNWSKIEALPPDAPIRIKLKAGDVREGRFRRMETDRIWLFEEGTDRAYAKADIDRIERIVGPAHSGRRGAITGLLAGGAAGGLIGGLLGNSFSDRGGAGDILSGALIVGGIGAAIGAAVGYGFSKVTTGTEILYRSQSAPADMGDED